MVSATPDEQELVIALFGLLIMMDQVCNGHDKHLLAPFDLTSL